MTLTDDERKCLSDIAKLLEELYKARSEASDEEERKKVDALIKRLSEEIPEHLRPFL